MLNLAWQYRVAKPSFKNTERRKGIQKKYFSKLCLKHLLLRWCTDQHLEIPLDHGMTNLNSLKTQVAHPTLIQTQMHSNN